MSCNFGNTSIAGASSPIFTKQFTFVYEFRQMPE
jgi:hypothetical protein